MNKKTPTFLIYCVDCDLQAAVMTGPFFSSSPILKPFLYRLVLGTVKNVLTNHHKQAHIHTHGMIVCWGTQSCTQCCSFQSNESPIPSFHHYKLESGRIWRRTLVKSEVGSLVEIEDVGRISYLSEDYLTATFIDAPLSCLWQSPPLWGRKCRADNCFIMGVKAGRGTARGIGAFLRHCLEDQLFVIVVSSSRPWLRVSLLWPSSTGFGCCELWRKLKMYDAHRCHEEPRRIFFIRQR